MSEEDKHFIKRYEELLDKGYCDCNEMNCIDNNSPRRILNIVKDLQNQLQQKENIIKEVREDLYQVVKWCTENKHNEDTIERYLVVDYGTIVGKINEIRTKLDKGE